MRVAVTGGRDFNDRLVVWNALDKIHRETEITLLIHGACPVGTGGADMLAEQWARYNEVPYVGVPAKFKTGKHGKAEGPLRNLRMLTMFQAERLVAFPGGSGTNSCVKEAKKLETPITDLRK